MDFYETLREYVSAREDSVYASAVTRDPVASRAHSDRAIEAFMRLVKIHDDMRVLADGAGKK